jgi:hypothetical protein
MIRVAGDVRQPDCARQPPAVRRLGPALASIRGKSEDRDPAEVDLLFAGQREQQIDRPFIAVELEHELLWFVRSA